ncbi:tRNA (adenosine(37)-N6)-threonylcarbamoyltransferase complex dimerization subunit type 1 TsaB [Paenibacillus spongiae]|uniref:tRNA (Adenosine(37)-N6)-threonylcarbamoyltransferase complex dimerization subunit type 1 TsaB n=1 Tax=Paenibacillus spongiae TaxID=2909671 RepID=A0ABY5SEP6_9BACL|nr:tRNA (adenosine(37)-N6)-threonylcarbamoyltransferase complex dimerization subunit type 1 TsaB [Paenibacillus spongiae]UVI31158.1 tRNA (adenosine(37)-N6)-threonylcarbamoyltransferase complex dimerization subunit type 1 TsaB [Paenibacillus spongiae]
MNDQQENTRENGYSVSGGKDSHAETSAGAAGKPIILAVDTSTALLAMALVRGEETLGSVQSMAERNHSVYTVTKLKSLLDDCGVTPEQLGGIAIGRGPGSYTGMRIAVSVGKTLAWVWKKPLIGVSSLEALAFGSMQPGAGAVDWYVPLMDARRGQVYTALFAASENGGWTRLAEDGVRLMKDWVDVLADRVHAAAERSEAPERIWFVGDLSLHEAEALRLQECLGAKPAADGSPASGSDSGNACGTAALCDVRLLPSVMEGRAVAVLGAQRLANGEGDDVHTFVPNYTQLTEAEVKLQAKSREKEGERSGSDR